jgi:hypothetical protein
MPYTTNAALYLTEERTRINKYYKTNRTGKLAHFQNLDQFENWYFDLLNDQQLRCHYCDISILSIRHLLNENLIQGRLVKSNSYRGPNFEFDRKDPHGPYNQDNCVVCCYYCNNDKSNTFTYNVYKEIIGPAKGVALKLLLG